MKRLMVLTLALVLAGAVFADDALVLPTGVIRVRATGAYTMATQTFDTDGEKQDIAFPPFPGVVDSINTLNVGGAVELGVVKGVNIALQWIPGYVLYSKFDSTALDKANVNGALDAFAGAKVQILGDQGLIANDKMRFAVAAGAIVPMAGADWADETTNMGTGKEFILKDADYHAWAVGGRAYFDYIINPMIFVNLYSEYINYFTVDAGKLGAPTPEKEYAYGYQLTLELEPHFEMPVAEGIVFKAGLPVTYVVTPEVEVDGTAVADTDTTSCTLRPNVALFVRKPLPFELEVGYMYPILGRNTTASSAITFQLKAYIRAFGQ